MSKPSSIVKTLAKLKRTPAPVLPASVKTLRITMAMRNAHFGARHFVKDELPRVAYNNPSLAIDVQRKEKAKEENWDPELVIELADGTTQTINMQMKHSDAILTELLRVSKASAPSATA